MGLGPVDLSWWHHDASKRVRWDGQPKAREAGTAKRMTGQPEGSKPSRIQTTFLGDLLVRQNLLKNRFVFIYLKKKKNMFSALIVMKTFFSTH